MNLTKLIAALITTVIAFVVIQNLVAVSEFHIVIGLLVGYALPVLIGLGAATKVGNKKEVKE